MILMQCFAFLKALDNLFFYFVDSLFAFSLAEKGILLHVDAFTVINFIRIFDLPATKFVTMRFVVCDSNVERCDEL